MIPYCMGNTTTLYTESTTYRLENKKTRATPNPQTNGKGMVGEVED